MTTAADIATDLLTPLGAYRALRGHGRGAFLLESVERGRLGRFSFVGCGSRLCTLDEAEASGEPVVGYLGYDHVARLEPTVPLPDEGPALAESRFVAADLLLRFDHVLGAAEVLHGDEAEAADALLGPVPPSPPGGTGSSRTRRAPTQARYEAGVRRAKEHIRAGDAFQIVLSQRAERRTSASALDLYRALRRVNPSPYLFLLELDGLALIGSSPETLVNLGRNDLSRVCVPGTVEVTRFLEVERYSHVTHLVSQVSGDLRDGVSPFDLLRACFPAGTVSGAPKVRAMQLISELERRRRGPYAGAVGYALPEEATLDTCIAIRTIVLRDGVAHVQAGAGIVADSEPAAEHEECLRKLAALEAAIDRAEAAAPSSAPWGGAGGAGPEGTVQRGTAPESPVPPASSG